MVELTGLGAATMSSLANALIDDGVVHEVGNERAMSRRGAGGRRQVLLDIKADAAYFIGMHFGVRTFGVAISDLRGNVREYRGLRHQPEARLDAAGTIAAACDLATDLLLECGIDRRLLLGVGVSAVGVVDPEAGVIRYAPELGWSEVAVRDIVEQSLDLPVAIDNSRRAMMVGEVLLGVARQARNAMLVHVATTVGAALLVNGEIVYGDSFGAGQLGHVVVEVNDEPGIDTGSSYLETIVSELALVRKARVLAPTSAGSRMLALAGGEVNQIEPLTIYQAALEGDALASNLVASCARTLGKALVPALGLLDPELLIVTGEIQLAGASFFKPLTEAIDRGLLQVLGHTIRVLPSSFGVQANILSAIALALNRYYHTSAIRIRPSQQPRQVSHQVGLARRAPPRNPPRVSIG